MSDPPTLPPRLSLSGISKIYPSVVANDGVDLDVLPGEIHAVLGENGAGKSTLMKIIYGVVRPDAGTIRWNGEPVTIGNPAQARRLGIGMVFQHFSLFETLTVAENIAAGPRPCRAPADLAARIREVSHAATACRSIPTGTYTRCRSASGSASRSSAACCRIRGC